MENETFKNTYTADAENGFAVTTKLAADDQLYKLEYTIDRNGALEFSYAENPDFDLLIKNKKTILAAQAVFDIARELNAEYCMECLKGRSVKGIRGELRWHYRFFKSGVFKRHAEPANIGSTDKMNAGYDNNAWIFELISKI